MTKRFDAQDKFVYTKKYHLPELIEFVVSTFNTDIQSYVEHLIFVHIDVSKYISIFALFADGAILQIDWFVDTELKYTQEHILKSENEDSVGKSTLLLLPLNTPHWFWYHLSVPI